MTSSSGGRTPTRRGRGWLIAVVLLAAAHPACSSVDPDQRTDAPRTVVAAPVAKLPTTATGLTAGPGGDEALVTDRSGVVWSIPTPIPTPDGDLRTATRVLDLRGEVSTLGERGMFDIAAVPGHDLFVISYTDESGTITVEAFPRSPGRRIERSTGRKLVQLPRPYAWHNGGGMAFDRSNNLLLGVGDMEFRGIGLPGSQDPGLILGAVLRIPAPVVTGERTDWVASPADVVARGLRNPWRLSTDPASGDVWIGDVGLNSFEEVNRIPSDQVGTGTNFGWPHLEGPVQASPPPEGAVLTPPVLAREHGPTTCGIVGGPVYRGSALPALTGWYLYSDLCGDEVRALRLDGDRATSDRPVAALGESLVSFGVGPGSEVYGLGSGGTIVLLVPSDRDLPQPTPTARQTQDCQGIISAIVPLEGFGELSPAEIEPRMRQANRDVAEAMDDLPEDQRADAVVIQRVFLELQRRLEQVGWDVSDPAIQTTRQEMLDGTGAFEGLPDALARTVDATCG